jgi:hypothetical protein
MAEQVAVYENVTSTKNPEQEVRLIVYSDGHVREMDYSNGRLVTRINPTEIYASADVRAKKFSDAMKADRDAILASDGITPEHDDYEKLCKLLETWLGASKSDSGIRSFNAYQALVGGGAVVERQSENVIHFEGDTYVNLKRQLRASLQGDPPPDPKKLAEEIYSHNEKDYDKGD